MKRISIEIPAQKVRKSHSSFSNQRPASPLSLLHLHPCREIGIASQFARACPQGGRLAWCGGYSPIPQLCNTVCVTNTDGKGVGGGLWMMSEPRIWCVIRPCLELVSFQASMFCRPPVFLILAKSWLNCQTLEHIYRIRLSKTPEEPILKQKRPMAATLFLTIGQSGGLE